MRALAQTSTSFKNCKKKLKLWKLFTKTPERLQGPRVLSKLTRKLGKRVTVWNQRDS